MRRLWLTLLGLLACRSPGTTNAGLPVLTAAPSDAQAALVGDEPPRAPPPSRPSALAAPSVTSDWCVDGLSALDEDVCYVLPPLADRKPRRLPIYLPGIGPPQPTS